MDLLLVVLGVAVVVVCADWLVRGAVGVATHLEVPRFVVGLTVVSIGTSAPELFVAGDAAWRGAGDLVLGNVMGSNLANLGLILGITALIRPVPVHSVVVRRDLPIMLLVTILLFPFLAGSVLGRLEGGLLLGVFVAYAAILLLCRETPAVPVLEEEAKEGLGRPVLLLALGLGGLLVGSEVLVSGALGVARSLGVPELLVGLTVVAVGTSIPEMATSTVAALRRESGLALGNVVGSNIANLTLVLGSAALLRPFDVHPGVVVRELPVVLALSVLTLPLAWSDLRLQRWEGGVLLGTYAALAAWLFLP